MDAFEITKPGYYRLRCGFTVKVKAITSQYAVGTWVGEEAYWDILDGRFYKPDPKMDITGEA